jgi:hypothetical protein
MAKACLLNKSAGSVAINVFNFSSLSTWKF